MFHGQSVGEQACLVPVEARGASFHGVVPFGLSGCYFLEYSRVSLLGMITELVN